MSLVAVLEDAILAQGGALPDELCPLILVALGARLGGLAAMVAGHVRDELGVDGWFDPFDPEAIWRDLCAQRGSGGVPFDGLLLEEVQSAVWFHAESLRSLRAVGLREVPGADAWTRLRTSYQARAGMLQIAESGRASWVPSSSLAARQFKKPIQSKISRKLVQGCQGHRLPLALATQGWRGSDGDLLRDQGWYERSRTHRARWKKEGRGSGRVHHRWERAVEGDLERCKSCGAWRYRSEAGAYRYAEGTEPQARLAREAAQGLSRPPLCHTR